MYSQLIYARLVRTRLRRGVVFRSASLSAAPPPPPPTRAHDPTAIPGASVGGTDGHYVMLYTCRVCDTRSARRITKQAYHHGTVLVRCPGCKGLHLIADHLGFVSDDPVDVEELLAARGEAVATRSRIGAAALEFGSGTTGDGGGAGGDALVYELSPDDVRVLASRTKAVRLRSGPHGHAGEEVEGVTFAGVVPQREDSKDPAA